MIDKIFYSFFLEGEHLSSQNQIQITKAQFSNESALDQVDNIQLGENIYISSEIYDFIFMASVYKLDLMDIGAFLDYHRDEYEGAIEDFITKIRYISDNSNQRHFRYMLDYRMAVQDWVNNQNLQSAPKLKWIGKTAQFGYIFLELAKKGYIELPQTKGVDSYKKYARFCYEMFEMNTTLGTLENELNPRRNSLEPPIKEAFKIPNKSELS